MTFWIISEFEDLEELEQSLNDDLWTVDSVTGNASGSYTFNRYQAQAISEALEEVEDEFNVAHENSEE